MHDSHHGGDPQDAPGSVTDDLLARWRTLLPSAEADSIGLDLLRRWQEPHRHYHTLTHLRTYPLASRKSKVSVRDFAKAPAANPSLSKFLASLPNFLAAADLRDLLGAIHTARKQRRAILWGIGGHVIKVGLGPLLIDLMRRGFITSLAMNGAALVHDFEIALVGNTSEDVDTGLGDGAFGMAAETGEYLNQIAKVAMRARLGYGEAAGQFLDNAVIDVPYARFSVLAAAYKLRIPVTVHLAIGTDIPHMHRTADGPALGSATWCCPSSPLPLPSC